MSDNVIDFFDNQRGYVPPCCRPGGRCTTGHEVPDVPLRMEDEDKITDLINSGASMKDVLALWRELKFQEAER